MSMHISLSSSAMRYGEKKQWERSEMVSSCTHQAVVVAFMPFFDNLWTTSVTSIEGNDIGTVDMLEQIIPRPNKLSFVVTVSVIVVATAMLMVRHLVR